MPGNAITTLYPPQISTFMPAFVNTTDAVVYFSLSSFNSSSEIQRVHVSLVNQLNNENALNNVSGILISPLRYDTASGMYYVVIPVTSIAGNQFNINQFYKVQLRFDSFVETPDDTVPTDDKNLTMYLLDHQQYFSEWSSVCLLRPILQPTIRLKTFDTYEGENTISFNKGIIPIAGKLYFGDNSVVETETLQSYQIQILKKDSDEVVLQSPTIYTGDNLDPNDINYRIDLQGLREDDGSEFRLKVTITTKNQYTTSKTWNFQIADFLDEETFDPELTVEMDNDEGIANLYVRNVQTVFGTIYIKRGSSIDNFETWEDIYVEKVTGDIDLHIQDNTVSSLVWYRYSIQLENSRGALTNVYRSQVFMPEFYDVIISRGTRQFKIQYNYSISSFKPVVNRAKIDTLGGRFPKFAENAILNYKQFSISGLISAEADVYQNFLDKEDYFGDDNYDRYQVYKSQSGVKDVVRNDYADYNQDNTVLTSYLTTTQNDWLWEREFREEAMKWLNDGEPKLYRSMTEGNLAVMLTDISLTPNSTLGRRLYSFTATVYEIAEAHSLETLNSLGIYDVVKPKEVTSGGGGGAIDPEPEYVEVMKVGQLYQFEVTDKNNVLSVILNQLKEKYGGVLDDKDPDDLYLKSVKIFFHNRPNVYLQEGQNLMLIENPGSSAWTDEQRRRMVMGYVVNVGTSASEGQSLFFVNDKGYYQLPEALDITHISFDRIGDIVTLEYVMVYKEKNDTSTIISGSSIDRTVVGQEEGVFEPNAYLGEAIRAKYNFVKTDDYIQRMQYWRGICLDVEPFAVAHIQYYKEDVYNDYVVGETGVYHMLKDVPVQDMCFIGRRMKEQALSRQRFLEDWEYVLDTGSYNSTSQIRKPKRNTVYSIGNSLKIYYKDQWYDFQEKDKDTGIAVVPIEGLITYLGNIIQEDM